MTYIKSIRLILLSLVLIVFVQASPLPVIKGHQTNDKDILLSVNRSEGIGEENLTVVSGELLEHNAEQVIREYPNMLVLRSEGFHKSEAKVLYQIGDKIPPGEYAIWTRFTQGGAAEQTFKVSMSGGIDNNFEERLRFRQNSKSWDMVWRQVKESLYVYPEDTSIQVETEGNATQQKQLGDYYLQWLNPLPDRLTLLRHKVSQRFSHPDAKSRLVLIDGDESMLPLFESLLNRSDLERFYQLQLLDKNESNDLRELLNISADSWVLNVGSNQAIYGMWSSADLEHKLSEVLEALGDPEQRQSLPSEATVQVNRDLKFEVMADGRPDSWLFAGHWAGPAGLSLWGLDYEPQLSPNPNDPVVRTVFDRVYRRHWTRDPLVSGRIYTQENLDTDYVWPKGTGYGHLYVFAEEATQAILHIGQTGIITRGWVNGAPLEFVEDHSNALERIQANVAFSNESQGLTDQGDIANVQRIASEPPMAAQLKLEPGWNRVLVKFIHQHPKGGTFSYSTRFTDLAGNGLELKTSLSNPNPTSISRSIAARLIPTMRTNAPFNMVHPGTPLSVRIDLGTVNYYRTEYERNRSKTLGYQGEFEPYIPFDGRLELTVYDYDGNVIVQRTGTGTFPDTIELDLGVAPSTGYYYTSLKLYDMDGQFVTAYPPDGFSVIKGTAAQASRRDSKEIAVTYYFMQWEYDSLFFPYMQRIGIFRNIGGGNGRALNMYQAAVDQGIILTADLWNREGEYLDEYVKETAPYVDSYKSYNEVDIHPDQRRTPEYWVGKAKAHYDTAKKYDPEALVIGASFARPGADDWFAECLQLGLANYHDVWDVHCYPQKAPVLEGTMSNSPRETELGVLKSMREIGMENTKPFWIGETGARSSHGEDARRWQADTVAKMAACALSREDFEKIGFLIPWRYSREYSAIGDIEVGHMPGEAAYYTASALIDGFEDYERLDLGPAVQAARFGPTMMLWTTGNGTLPIQFGVSGSRDLVCVDVVGRVQPLDVGPDQVVSLTLTQSPVYILSLDNYNQLTAFTSDETN